VPEVPEACLLGHNIYELLAPQLLKKRYSATVNAQLVDHSLFSALGYIARLDLSDPNDHLIYGFNTVNGRERRPVKPYFIFNNPGIVKQSLQNLGESCWLNIAFTDYLHSVFDPNRWGFST
jgi:hypothetical protein